MFDVRKVKKGDILVYKAEGIIGSLIGWFSGGSWAHVSIVSDDSNGVIKIIEAHLDAEDDRGRKNNGYVHEKTFNSGRWGKKVCVRRVPYGLSPEKADKLISYMRIYDVGKTKYDLESFPSMFFRSRIGQLLGWRNWRKNRPFLNDPKKQVCSTLVATRYKNVLGINICRGVNEHSVTPVDVANTKSLKTIC